jgi:hypothetical protein
MRQWLPQNPGEVLWNDRPIDRFVGQFRDTGFRIRRTFPVDCVNPDGQFGLTADFSSIQVMRPGYRYAGLADCSADDLAPQASGVFRIDLQSGQASGAIAGRSRPTAK